MKKAILITFLYYFQNITTFSFDLVTYVLAIGFFMIADYMLCYFVSKSTVDVTLAADFIYDLTWYQLPRKQQFIVQMITMRAQIPYNLKGLGVFICSLEAYLKVIFDLSS